MIAAAKPGRPMPEDVAAQLVAPRHDDLPFPVATSEQWWSADRRLGYAGWSGHATSLGVGAFTHKGPSSISAFSGHLWLDDRPWY